MFLLGTESDMIGHSSFAPSTTTLHPNVDKLATRVVAFHLPGFGMCILGTVGSRVDDVVCIRSIIFSPADRRMLLLGNR